MFLAGVLCLIILTTDRIGAENILLVSGPSKSHYLMFNTIGEALVKGGHTVYSVLPASETAASKEATRRGLRPLLFDVGSRTTTFQQLMEEFSVQFLENKNGKIDLTKGSNFALEECQCMMDDEAFLEKVKSLKIKLAFVDGLPVIPCPAILPEKFGIPYISMESIEFFYRVPSIPSIVPFVMTSYTDQMNFWQRTINTFIFVALQVYPVFPAWSDTRLIEKHVKGAGSKGWVDLMLGSELLISTRDSILEWPAPTMPHHITLACLTCSPAFPLPSDIEAFYSKATNGVIVVSFGSMAGGFPESISNRLMQAFRDVKYHVIWRYIGASEPKEIPEHIKLIKWMPQNDLLGHNKTKLFITHCGNNGQYEAVYHGVPMVGLPLAADQPHNGHRIVSKGIGMVLDIHTFKVIELVNAIYTVISEPHYTQNVRKMSAILKDEPMTPQQKTVYWTEHILKFGGGHLRSHGLDMPLYQFYLVDVAAFVLGSLLASITALYCIIRSCYRNCCRKYLKQKTA